MIIALPVGIADALDVIIERNHFPADTAVDHNAGKCFPTAGTLSGALLQPTNRPPCIGTVGNTHKMTRSELNDFFDYKKAPPSNQDQISLIWSFC
jgi:hypothetical protein